jgi:hypothetical protein
MNDRDVKPNGSNDYKDKTKIIFLPIPEELKKKGVTAITYARFFLSINYKNRLFTFTVYKEDVTKTHRIYEKELDHEVDATTKDEIWFKCICHNWIKHIYTEEEIGRDEVGGKGNTEVFLETARNNCNEIFKDEYKVAHAAVMINEHLEILPIGESRFKNWLRKTVKREHDVIISSQMVEDVVNTLIADAEFDGETKELGLRLALAPDNELKWYYDLTNDAHEIIEITSEGWKITKNKILFRRFDHQKPQDYPTPTHDYPSDILDQFMNLLNVKKENRLLLKCYIISLFIPNLSKAVLMVHGEQGTAKSMLEELIKMLVDPSVLMTLSFPKDIAELVQQLSHHSLTYYDNLSRIPEWISDLLCRAVTGSGFSKRRLYTNDQDVIYSLMRAIGFNGINLAATKADLLDRGLIIQTDTIPKGNRLRMKAIWEKFYTLRPQLLGYIFDVLVKVLKWMKQNPGVELIKQLPRMADWSECCEIISRSTGNPDDAFINAYNENTNLQTEEVIEGSDIAISIRMFLDYRKTMKEGDVWTGTATKLLAELNQTASSNDMDTHNKYWPKSAGRLSRILRTLQRTLREIGIELEWNKDTSTKKSTRIITIRYLSSEPSDCQNHEDHSQNNGQPYDGTESKENKVSSEKKSEICAQNDASDASDASDSILKRLTETKPPTRPSAYVNDENDDGEQSMA